MSEALPPLDNTMGAMLIGVVIASALWGVTCIQSWTYYASYPRDAWYLKTLVAAVLVCDTIHQILISHTIYTYLVTNYGNDIELGDVVWSILAQVLFAGITAFLVQSFLALRVWRFSNHNLYITTAVAALVLAEFTSVIVYTVKAIHVRTFAASTSLRSSSMIINALGAASDVLIAVVLCTMLQNSRTGFKKSDTIINKLTIFTINTGLLTSICAVASLISIAAAPRTFIYIAFFFNMGRLYSNTLMATLNARNSFRGESDEVMTVSLQGMRPGVSIMTPRGRAQSNLTIRVDTTRTLTRDHTEAEQSEIKIDMMDSPDEEKEKECNI